jgi:hypothetical protein
MPILRRTLCFSLAAVVLCLTAHRLPAPIQEIAESPTPAPSVASLPMSKEKPRIKPKPKSDASPSATTAVRQQANAKRSRFAGAWVGIMPTFPWGSIPQTITIDSAETTMTRARDWSSTQPGGTVKAEVKGDTLTASFGSGGVLSLTPQGDGSTAVVRLRAPFNDQTAIFRKTSP